MGGGEFLFGESEAAARGGHRFGAVGREPCEVVGELLPVARVKLAAGQPQLVAGGEDADDVVAWAARASPRLSTAGLSAELAARIRTFSMPMLANSCSHSWGAVICSPLSVASSSSIGGAAWQPSPRERTRRAASWPNRWSRIQNYSIAERDANASTEGVLMSRPVTLFTGQWADLPLEDMCRKASDFGYQGLELACWGDHFEVNKAVADSGYCGGQARPAGPLRPAVPRDQLAPGGPGGVRSHRRSGTRRSCRRTCGATAIRPASIAARPRT